MISPHSAATTCMKVSVILPNLHSPLIAEVITAVYAQTQRTAICEILVVGPDKYGLIQEQGRLQHLSPGQALSSSGARNHGAQQAQGDLLWFIDADVIPQPHALGYLIQAQQAGGYDCVGAGLIPEPGKYWQLAANLMAFPENLNTSQPGPRAGTPSFCMLMTRQAWQQFGPYDQSFGNACEDMDLSYRIRNAGGSIGCEPRAEVYHRPVRSSMRDAFQRHQLYGSRMLLLYQRHAHMLPRSYASWIIEHTSLIACPALLLLAVLYVLRLMLQQPGLRHYWYTIPAMAWLQYGYYLGAWATYQPREDI